MHLWRSGAASCGRCWRVTAPTMLCRGLLHIVVPNSAQWKHWDLDIDLTSDLWKVVRSTWSPLSSTAWYCSLSQSGPWAARAHECLCCSASCHGDAPASSCGVTSQTMLEQAGPCCCAGVAPTCAPAPGSSTVWTMSEVEWMFICGPLCCACWFCVSGGPSWVWGTVPCRFVCAISPIHVVPVADAIPCLQHVGWWHHGGPAL